MTTTLMVMSSLGGECTVTSALLVSDLFSLVSDADGLAAYTLAG